MKGLKTVCESIGDVTAATSIMFTFLVEIQVEVSICLHQCLAQMCNPMLLRYGLESMHQYQIVRGAMENTTLRSGGSGCREQYGTTCCLLGFVSGSTLHIPSHYSNMFNIAPAASSPFTGRFVLSELRHSVVYML